MKQGDKIYIGTDVFIFITYSNYIDDIPEDDEDDGEATEGGDHDVKGTATITELNFSAVKVDGVNRVVYPKEHFTLNQKQVEEFIATNNFLDGDIPTHELAHIILPLIGELMYVDSLIDGTVRWLDNGEHRGTVRLFDPIKFEFLGDGKTTLDDAETAIPLSNEEVVVVKAGEDHNTRYSNRSVWHSREWHHADCCERLRRNIQNKKALLQPLLDIGYVIGGDCRSF